MANALTGKFDAVLQVRTETVNRILATLHEHGAGKDASPSFLHSFAVRVGDPPGVANVEWAISASLFQLLTGWAKASPKPSKEPPEISNAPPGISEAWQEAVDALSKQATLKFPLEHPRGTARVQLSTPAISVAENSVSTVTAHMSVRARYTPDAGTKSLPEPIHGELQAAFSVEATSWAAQGKQILTVKPSADPKQIKFVPAEGTLGSMEAAQITAGLRAALKDSFEATNVELPKGFTFHGFKGFWSGGAATIAVPIDLSGTGPSAIDSVPAAALLNPADHFAVAVSREYIESALKPFLNQILAFKETFTVEVDFFYIEVFKVVIHVSVSSATLTWLTGSIVLTVTGQFAINGNASSFTVTQVLTLDPVTLKISLSEPVISGLPQEVIDDAKASIASMEAGLMGQVQSVFNTLKEAATPDKLVKTLNPSIAAKLTSAHIQPEGLRLHGVVTVPWRLPAQAIFTETGDGKGFTALQSWVPGGTIASYKWSFDAQVHPHYANPWGKVASDVVDAHSFVVPLANALPPGTRTCLTIEGQQIPSMPGNVTSVSAMTCEYTAARLVRPLAGLDFLAVPAVPIWAGNVSAQATLEDETIAHISAFAEGPSASVDGATLVHFADAQSQPPLEMLGRALARRSGRSAPLSAVIVLPTGSLREPRAAVERKLGAMSSESVGTLLVTEDYERGWSRTFAVEHAPATFLMNRNGEVVWRHSGQPDTAAIARAIDEHVFGELRPSPSLVRLAVKRGDRAPDVSFAYAPGELIALRKLRGERVLLAFWKSWSAPSVRALRELQRLHARPGVRVPVIVAVGDGETADTVERLRREHNLTFTIAADPARHVARAYRVSCWPTTVSIDAQGVVERIRFGIARQSRM